MTPAERAAEKAHNAAILAAEEHAANEGNHTRRMTKSDWRELEKQDLPPQTDPVPPFFDPYVHGDPIYSLDIYGRKVPHPKYDNVNMFYTSTPPGQTIPHFYSVYQQPGRLPRSLSTKDALSQAQRHPTNATQLAWDAMLTKFVGHTCASRALAREYMQFYRDADLAVQAFFHDAAERQKPADDATKVPHSQLTKAAIAAAAEEARSVAAQLAMAAAAAAVVDTPVVDVMEEDPETGAFVSAPQYRIELTEKIAQFCQSTNQNSDVARYYIDMYKGPVQLAIDAFMSFCEEDGATAQMAPRAVGGHGGPAAQGRAATNLHTSYVDADGQGRLPAGNGRRREQTVSTHPPTALSRVVTRSHATKKPPSEHDILEFEKISGEMDRRVSVAFLNLHGTPAAAFEAWETCGDSDEDLIDPTVQGVPVTADSGLVLQFMGTTGANYTTTESYLVKYGNNIVGAVSAYWADRDAMTADAANPK